MIAFLYTFYTDIHAVLHTPFYFTFQAHLDAVSKGVESYRRTIHTLERKNSKLLTELDALHEAEDVSIQPRKGKSGGPTVTSLQAQVRKLKRENKKLEEVGPQVLSVQGGLA